MEPWGVPDEISYDIEHWQSPFTELDYWTGLLDCIQQYYSLCINLMKLYLNPGSYQTEAEDNINDIMQVQGM